MASMSALVSANGRLFYIFDEGSTASILLPSKWFLAGRDAFNGTILWKRPIDNWHTHLWPLKSGPAQLPRRLVAAGDRVYVVLAEAAGIELWSVDAAGGRLAGYFFLGPTPADGPPFAIPAGELAALLEGSFERLEDSPVEAPLPVFGDAERWQVWQRRAGD